MPVARKQKRPRQQGRPFPAAAVGREAIIAAVREALKVTPPGELTFKTIADIAKIDQRLIRYYYGYLPDLLRVVAIEVTEELRLRFGEENAKAGRSKSRVQARHRLRSRIEIFLDFFGNNPHYHRLVVDFLINSKGPERDAAVARFRSSVDELQSLLQDCSPSGKVSKMDAQFMHVSIAALCEYLFSAEPIFTALFQCEIDDPRFRERFADFITNLILGSLNTK